MTRFEKLLSKRCVVVVLLFCRINTVFTLPVEPGCTRFAYEEQLLEKMVRMEFFVENMQKDVQNSVNNVMDVMKGIEEKNSEITDNFSGLPEKIEKLEKQIEDITATMARNKNVGEEEKTSESSSAAVAFNAYIAVTYSGSDVIVFSSVIMNEGKAYNNTTGIFTAPVDGIFQFNVHLCFQKDEEVDYYLKVGDLSIASGEYRVPEGATDTKCTSFSAVALVRKDEEVRVGGMTFTKLDQKTDDWNSFSGVLIQKV